MFFVWMLYIYSVVLHNLPMYDFSIVIPFKSSQSTLNFEASWSAVSYLVRGIIDIAHHQSAVSLTGPTIGQLCLWHRWVFVQSLHSWIRSFTDTTQLMSAASMTMRITGRQCHCGIMLDWGRIRHWIFGSVDLDPVKMLRICHHGGQCQWHRWPLKKLIS
jgi:hypothetical protein